MPYEIRYVKGSKRPWKVVKLSTGKTVGSSSSEAMAKAAIRARYWGESKK